jgi:hypothetical protein
VQVLFLSNAVQKEFPVLIERVGRLEQFGAHHRAFPAGPEHPRQFFRRSILRDNALRLRLGKATGDARFPLFEDRF